MTESKCLKVWQMTKEEIIQRNKEIMERNRREEELLFEREFSSRKKVSHASVDSKPILYRDLQSAIQTDWCGIQRVTERRSERDRGTTWVRICSYGNTHLSDEIDQDSYEFN